MTITHNGIDMGVFCSALITGNAAFLMFFKNDIYNEINHSYIEKMSISVGEWRDQADQQSTLDLGLRRFVCGVALVGLTLASPIEAIISLFMAIILSPVELISTLSDLDFMQYSSCFLGRAVGALVWGAADISIHQAGKAILPIR